MVSPTQSVPQVLAVWGSNKKEASSVPEVRDYGSIKKTNPNISTKNSFLYLQNIPNPIFPHHIIVIDAKSRYDIPSFSSSPATDAPSP